ncbi:MAG: hypothetical protein V7L05_13485 [Nostoc sp.]
MGSGGDEGDEGDELITNAQCPMPNAQCPMPNAQFLRRTLQLVTLS